MADIRRASGRFLAVLVGMIVLTGLFSCWTEAAPYHGRGQPFQQAPETARKSRATNTRQAPESTSTFLVLHPDIANELRDNPSLIDDPNYLNDHPALSDFVATHPEFKAHPSVFLGGKHPPAEAAAEQAEQQAADAIALAEAAREGGFRNGRPPRVVIQRDGDDRVSETDRMLDNIIPFLIFVGVTLALLWILQVILTNRRWSKMAKMQADVHTKLMEKFASSQELAAYIESEAGKRFLESTPIEVDLPQTRTPFPYGRIMWSVQVGLILGLAGIGLLLLRPYVPDGAEPLLIFGTLAATIGLAFIISAIVSYVLSRHMGLLTHAQATPSAGSAPGSRI